MIWSRVKFSPLSCFSISFFIARFTVLVASRGEGGKGNLECRVDGPGEIEGDHPLISLRGLSRPLPSVFRRLPESASLYFLGRDPKNTPRLPREIAKRYLTGAGLIGLKWRDTLHAIPPDPLFS